MKKFFIVAAVLFYGFFAGAGNKSTVQNWSAELETAKGQGIIFSDDNQVLLKCPVTVVSVEIPSCVTAIGHKAFAKCTKLNILQNVPN